MTKEEIKNKVYENLAMSNIDQASEEQRDTMNAIFDIYFACEYMQLAFSGDIKEAVKTMRLVIPESAYNVRHRLPKDCLLVITACDGTWTEQGGTINLRPELLDLPSPDMRILELQYISSTSDTISDSASEKLVERVAHNIVMRTLTLADMPADEVKAYLSNTNKLRDEMLSLMRLSTRRTVLIDGIVTRESSEKTIKANALLVEDHFLANTCDSLRDLDYVIGAIKERISLWGYES